METSVESKTIVTKGHSAEHFGEYRDYWWNKDFLELMSKRWHLEKIHSLLDVGCGVGHWGQILSPFLPENAKIFGIDREREWVQKAQERTQKYGDRFEYRQGCVEEIPFPDRSFDMVTCQTLLIHVPHVKNALEEMLRVLKPGGLLVVVEPNNYANQLILDTLSIAEPLSDIIKAIQFHLICERGRERLGLGFESIGDIIPAYFQKLDLKNIQVYLSDKTSPLVPPYSTYEEQIWIKQLKDWFEEEFIVWNETDTKTYYLAGGGNIEDFNEVWQYLKKRFAKCLEAIANQTYSAAGGNILYLISGRK